MLPDWKCSAPALKKKKEVEKRDKPFLHSFTSHRLVRPLLGGNKPVLGLVVGVVSGEKKEVYGYGETGLHPGDTPDGDTLFEIASVTKPLTALLLAQLVARGELALLLAVAT